MKKIFYWFPRVLSILFIAFISIFALDVLGETQWFLALLMHLIPSFVLIIITILAWNKERLGGLLYILVGIFLLISSHFESLVISVPLIAIGALFFIAKHTERKIQ